MEDLPLLLRKAVLSDDLPLVKTLVSIGAQDSSCPLGNSCLHIAAGRGFFEIANFLIHRRFPQGRNVRGLTPLFLAAINKHAKTVRLLVETGSSVGLKCYLGLTILDHVETLEETSIRPEAYTPVKDILKKARAPTSPEPKWISFEKGTTLF